jgi:hypothetical protein
MATIIHQHPALNIVSSPNQKTVKIVDNVTVAANNGLKVSDEWVDVSGYERVTLNVVNETGTAHSASLYWSHDGATIHIDETALSSNVQNQRSYDTVVKAKYVKCRVVNGDTALAHKMNAWIVCRKAVR